MKTDTSNLEDRLTALFEDQAATVHAPGREWSELESPGPTLARGRRRLVALGAAALVPLAMVALLVTPGPQQLQTGAEQDTPAAALFGVTTPQVSLAAASFSIDVDGKRFVTTPSLEVNGDPGTPNEYTTLELTWQEHGVEMRLNIYFTSDGREWWSNEIRTYDGRAQGEWITYTGDFFRRPLGTAFTGDFEATASRDGIEGKLRLTDARLEVFPRPAACTAPAGPYAVDPPAQQVVLSPSATGGANVTLLDTAACVPVAPGRRFAFSWVSGDPGVVQVSRVIDLERGSHVDLQAAAPGLTTLKVTATDTTTGGTVAEATIEVKVPG